MFFPMTQIFGEIGQPHQDDRQTDDVTDVDPAVKHAGGDDRKSQTEDGPDDKLLKSGHTPLPFMNKFLTMFYSSLAWHRQYPVCSERERPGRGHGSAPSEETIDGGN